MLLAIMENSARAISLADRPQRAIRVTSVRTRREDPTSISSHPLADLGREALSNYILSRAGRSDRLSGGDRPRLEAPATSQNAPCDARQLVGERDRQHIVVQPPFGSLDPGFEPVALPALWPDQDDPGSLDEQHAQVAIAALGYLAKDRAVPRRDLPRDQPQPSGEVAALLERIPGADRSHHRTRDNRPDARHTHQPLATAILACECIDLARQALDPLIQATPVASQILYQVDHARRQHVAALGKDARQLSA